MVTITITGEGATIAEARTDLQQKYLADFPSEGGEKPVKGPKKGWNRSGGEAPKAGGPANPPVALVPSAPAPAPVPTAPPAEAVKAAGPTLDEVMAIAAAFAKQFGAEALKAQLKPFNVVRVSHLKPAQYADLATALEQASQPAQAAPKADEEDPLS